MGNDLYILFGGAIGVIFSIILFYLWIKKFEIAIFCFGLTPLISTIFYDNLPDFSEISTEVSIGIGGYLRSATLIGLGLVGLIRFINNFNKFKGKVSTQLLFLLIFIILGYVSSFYSLDQQFTIIRVSLVFSVFGFLLGFSSWLKENDKNLPKALNVLFTLVTILVLISFLSMILIPARTWWWKADRLLALWEHPNNFGAFCMLVYPIMFWKFFNTKSTSKYFIIIPIILTVTIHILSGSRTTLLTSAIGVIIWLLLERNWIKLFFTTILIGLSLIILINYSPASFTRQDDSKITDLSSRDQIWESAFIFIKEKPLIGYGFGVEGKIFQDESKLDLGNSFIERNVSQSLHNGYLSIIVSLGAIGFIIWLLTILFPLSRAFTIPFSTYKAYAIVTMIMVLITNFVESALSGYAASTDVMFWIAWIIAGHLVLKSYGNNDNLKKINVILKDF